MNVGRPASFKSVEELQEKIHQYFEEYKLLDKPLTVEMLAWRLGTNRQTILEYENKDEYSDTIKSAKEYILATKMENLNTRDGNTAGIIFDLCNNGKYSNKHANEDKGISITINDKSKEVLHD